MIQVMEGKIKQYRLPKTGTLKNGSTVSGYHLLDIDILKQEGWLPLEDNPPEHDEETQYLASDGYEILEDKVIKKYRIEGIPEREEPRDLEAEVEELRQVIDMLLGGDEPVEDPEEPPVEEPIEDPNEPPIEDPDEPIE